MTCLVHPPQQSHRSPNASASVTRQCRHTLDLTSTPEKTRSASMAPCYTPLHMQSSLIPIVFKPGAVLPDMHTSTMQNHHHELYNCWSFYIVTLSQPITPVNMFIPDNTILQIRLNCDVQLLPVSRYAARCYALVFWCVYSVLSTTTS